MDQATIVTPVPAPALRSETRAETAWNIRALPFLLSIITVALGLVYLAVIPPWAGPDEPRHFEYVEVLNNKGRLVSWADIDPKVMTQIIASMDSVNYWKWGVSVWKRSAPGELPKTFEQIWPDGPHQLHQPPLAYLAYLIPYKLFAESGIRTQLYAMRLLSILLNVVTVLAAYVAGRELFRDDPTMALALPAFVMLLPQHLFLHSTVMNDHLVEAALAWLIALMTRAFRLGLSLPRVLGMLVMLGIGLGAKRNALYGIVILAVAFLAYMFVYWGRGRLTTGQRVARLGGSIVVLSAAGIGVVWLWNWIQVNQPKLADYIVRLFLFLPTEQFPFELDARVISPAALPLYASYIKYTFISTWGHFGWMNITLGVQAYWGFAALSVLAAIGLAIFAMRGRRGLAGWQQAVLVTYGLSVVAAFLLVIAQQVRYWDLGWGGDPQGRYLFPVLIPMASLFLLGLRAYFPKNKYSLWFGLVVGALVLYNIVVLGFFIIPFYRT